MAACVVLARLGHFPTGRDTLFTEAVENPVQKRVSVWRRCAPQRHLMRFAPRWCVDAPISAASARHYTVGAPSDLPAGGSHFHGHPRLEDPPVIMKIVVADDLPASAVDLLRAVDGWTVDARAGRPRAELLRDVADADALLVRSATKVDRELLEAAPRLRIVARAGTGVDNVDLDVASSRGVMVTNAPGANSVSVAEHAFALLLALARRVPAADAAM